MWMVIKHFEKFPSLFARQLIGVNILPKKGPEWYMYLKKGLVFRSGREIVLTIGVCKKERKRAFAL